MLREIKELHGSTIQAQDGEIGKVDEILFDDAQWTVRYLIVDTGNWLFNRKVLISPMAIGLSEWDRQKLHVHLTRQQIENSPGVETDQPVSRQWERNYYNYYAWPYYWNGVAGWGPYWYPGTLFAEGLREEATDQQRSEERTLDPSDPNLRSTKEVTGYGINATDGHMGHVADFLVDDETWRISYLVADTQDWWPGKKVLIPSDEITQVNLPDRSVRVNVTREQIRSAPAWESGQKMDHTFEDQLYSYFARKLPGEAERLRFDLLEQINLRKEAKIADAVVAVYETHQEAEAAIRQMQRSGLDMTKLSIIGKDYHSEEDVVGYYNIGDRMKTWGATGAFWGGMWGLLFGSAFFLVPGIGPLLAAGPIVGWIVGAVEEAVVIGGLSALGAAFVGIGIPNDSVLRYESQLKAGKFIVISHDVRSDRDRALIAAEASRHQGTKPQLVSA